MKLLDYLRTREVTYQDFADRIGISVGQFHRIAHGKRGASLDVALKIERETDGVVTVADVAASKKSGARDVPKPAMASA